MDRMRAVVIVAAWILWRVGVGGVSSGVQAVWLPEEAFENAKECHSAESQARKRWEEEKAKWGDDKGKSEVVVRFTCLPDTINPPR